MLNNSFEHFLGMHSYSRNYFLKSLTRHGHPYCVAVKYASYFHSCSGSICSKAKSRTSVAAVLYISSCAMLRPWQELKPAPY
jgi:hypothetical protein